MPDPDRLRNLPSVASLLETPEIRQLLARVPRTVVVEAIRRTISVFRREASGIGGPFRSREEWTALLLSRLPTEIATGEAPSLRRVINATGVVIHTNLGRAPLPEEGIRAILEVARGYSNLEFDLASGSRSSRLVHIEERIVALTGAESAHVVNNNAAAVLLCLAGLARGREVLVSRGELVEIGGSFRIPDIMAESGAILVEVGTTNRTRLKDYEKAITGRTALLLKVHRSNFSISGFTEEVSAATLSALGERRGIPVMEDLGSGALFDFSGAGIPGTPTMRQALRKGPGVLTVSGDKLLGGPGGDHRGAQGPRRSVEKAPPLPGPADRQAVPGRAGGHAEPVRRPAPGACPRPRAGDDHGGGTRRACEGAEARPAGSDGERRGVAPFRRTHAFLPRRGSDARSPDPHVLRRRVPSGRAR